LTYFATTEIFNKFMSKPMAYALSKKMHWKICLCSQYHDFVTGWAIWGLIPGRDKRFSSSPKCPDRFWDSLSFLFSGYRELFPQAQSDQSVKLI
jgi:hypothetical protein